MIYNITIKILYLHKSVFACFACKGEKMSFWDMLIRLLVATACGGVVGIERGKKNRPAGFRTYILVCVGAALTMILSEYIVHMYPLWYDIAPTLLKSDMSRFGAQVINGIGFLGAGTIIVTGNQQVKGMTTAAGLWASACMGLAIGTGFYIGALIGCALIISTTALFSKLEAFIHIRSRNINIYVEMENVDGLTKIMECLRERSVRVYDVEFVKEKSSDSKRTSAVFSLKLPPKASHAVLITAIATIEAVRTIEEL